MDLIVLLVIAAVALFVLARLYSVLGRDVGMPPPTVERSVLSNEAALKQDSVKKIPSFSGLAALQKIDASFDPSLFLDGAKTAYEMIVLAFAEGDRKTLRSLLEDTVYETYEAMITERESEGRKIQVDIVRMHDSKIVEAEIDKKTAFITVEFHTDLSQVEKDENDQVINDEETGLSETVEQWTFSKQVNSSDPNWRLFGVAAIA